MGKYARLALTILLFLGLGLATSVAVAWGAQARLMATETISKSGVTTNQWLGVSLYRGVSMTEQGVLVWRLPDTGSPPGWSNLRLPPRDHHTRITVFESGWPWRCLGYELQRDASDRQALDLGQRGAIVGSLELSKLRKDWKDVHRLPYFVKPMQLIANTFFWVLAWLAFFCLPNLWRINQWYLLKPQRYCAWCRFDLKHATGDLCPECGKDQSRRPPLVSKPAASLALLILLIASIGIAGVANVFIMKRKTEPIHWASYLGDIETLRREIAAGADVNIKTLGYVRQGMTPLTLAVIGNHPEVAELLLQNGASFTLRGSLSEAPELAAQNGNASILQSMIQHGLDVDAPTLNGKTLLERAAVGNHFDVVDVLLEAGADDKVLFSGMTSLLHLAVKYGHKNFAEELIERGHDINQKDGAGKTPLLEASWMYRTHADLDIRRVRSEMTKMLIARGAAVDLGDSNGFEPIHEWADRGDMEILQLLIEKGADVNKATRNGITPLMHAVSSPSYDAVELLLEHGADVHKIAHEKYGSSVYRSSVLHFAARGFMKADRRQELVRKLLDLGLDVNGVEGQRSSPLDRAVEQHNQDIAGFLLDHGAKIGIRALGVALSTGQHELFDDLVARGGDVLERYPKGETLLFSQYHSSALEIMSRLIESELDVNAVNQAGETALMKAAEHKKPHYVHFLLSHGADPTIRMPDGSTALDKTGDAKTRVLLEEAIADWKKKAGVRENGEMP